MKTNFKIKLPKTKTIVNELAKAVTYAGIVSIPLLYISLKALAEIDDTIRENNLEDIFYGSED